MKWLRLMPRVHFLFRPFERVQEFIDSSPLKGLADTGDIGRILPKMRKTMESPEYMLQACGGALNGVNLSVFRYMLRICVENMEEEADMSEEIDQILGDLGIVRDEIEESELDGEVQKFCLDQIDALERALRASKLLGSQLVEEEIWGMGKAFSQTLHKFQVKIPKELVKMVQRIITYADKGTAVAGRLNSVAKLFEHLNK